MQIAFGRVRRKTSPAAVKYQTLLCSDVFGLYYNKKQAPCESGLVFLKER